LFDGWKCLEATDRYTARLIKVAQAFSSDFGGFVFFTVLEVERVMNFNVT